MDENQRGPKRNFGDRNVEKNVKFHSSLQKESRFIAENVTRKEEDISTRC